MVINYLAMLEYLGKLFESTDFMPHGHCYFWRPDVLWTNVLGDGIIALAYYTIPLALIYYARKRQEPYVHKVFWLFGAFILLCGTTHLIDIYTIWVPSYRLEGLLKVLTGLVSLITALYVFQILPSALKIPSPSQLKEANQGMAEFSYAVAHDLRSPMRHINGFATLLEESRKGDWSPREQMLLNNIRTIALEAGQKIDGLLNYKKLEQMAWTLSPVNTADLVHRIMEKYHGESFQKIHWKIGQLPVVVADPDLLEVIFFNLIDNAVKYSSQQAESQISIHSTQSRDTHHFMFRDNGIGFDMAYTDKLFLPFERLHADPQYDGHGIGLAQTERILQMVGGHIEAHSSPGEGSLFSISLPKNLKNYVQAR